MARRMRILAALLLLPVLACADSEHDRLPEELPGDDKLDSLSRPTLHGPLPFEVLARVDLTKEKKVHAFELEIGSTVEIGFEVRSPDLMVEYYVYEKQGSRWKRIAYEVQGYDSSEPLVTELEPGSYRLMLRPETRGETGYSDVVLTCTSGDCPDVTKQCIFGQSGDDFYWTALTLLKAGRTGNLSATDTISDITRRQFLAASGASSLEAAFAMTDGNLELTKLTNTLDGKIYYQLGWMDQDGLQRHDAFFAAGKTTKLATALDSGPVEGCKTYWKNETF
jgi:hypothetical protein